ncbi:hypothetical protein [Nocardia flavorosea]|uniref:Uncharacterized protein n=1 Tax=Nocardia flavorosea TaxID=53429 RepID=A0A846Y721_9NOCA|nr:hypothetical protein [Nocardia flavorosea]NKY54993.1 hypothetical protein [Nocardia flavorosea]
MYVRRLIAVAGFVASLSLGVSACTATGAGATSECDVQGCTVTFDRGVDAKISVLGVDAELAAVEGNVVTLKVAGQDVTVPMGSTESAQGLDLTVREITQEKVVVQLSTGL